MNGNWINQIFLIRSIDELFLVKKGSKFSFFVCNSIGKSYAKLRKKLIDMKILNKQLFDIDSFNNHSWKKFQWIE